MQTWINVNLKQCRCGYDSRVGGVPAATPHECPATRILNPCPIPRSVTFEVWLGKCSCNPIVIDADGGELHSHNCPARAPIRVACSVSGKTWEDSEVTDVDGPFFGQALETCRQRWGLVKALVLGKGPRDWAWSEVVVDGETAVRVAEFFAQRDTVYAALAKRAHAEDAGDESMAEFLAEVPGSIQVDVGHQVRPRLSEYALERYVEHLIEQVSVL